MTVADFGPQLRRAIALARGAGLGESAAELEASAGAACTTSSEWLGEVGAAILRFRAREGSRVPAEASGALDECLREIGKVWPQYAPGRMTWAGAWPALLVIGIVAIGLGIWWQRTRVRRGPDGSTVKAAAVRDLLYSLPTLCDTLPPLEEAAPPSDALVLDEDDWRQVEFVAVSERDGVLLELSELREWKAAQWTGMAWRSVFVRTTRPAALAGRGIRMAELEKAVPAVVGRRPLALRTMGAAAPVAGGFATDLSPGVVLYGHVVHGEVASLSVSSSNPELEGTPAAGALAAIRDRLHLELVDWYRTIVVG